MYYVRALIVAARSPAMTPSDEADPLRRRFTAIGELAAVPRSADFHEFADPAVEVFSVLVRTARAESATRIVEFELRPG
ncbi:hypothetical protein GCM10028798_12030 [Humibacter antri]